MKKTFFLLSITISGFAFAQEEEEIPAEPGDPVPIDIYIPALMGIGAGLATYYVKKQKNIS